MNRPGSARLTPLQHYTSAPSVDVSRSMVTGTGMGMVQGNAGVRTREDVLQGGVKMSLAHGVGQKNSGN